MMTIGLFKYLKGLHASNNLIIILYNHDNINHLNLHNSILSHGA